ncbi:uncharacterized protein A1O5_03761 [Cladophialophora psammophila CBS 110553]|uniref:Uncharacterized protein n=1 Tax=Cladophialophora psammophila CBS 110553 TaxID=1182543 RepID=W9X5L3_9EURO|nr:uncharacterized protein A1O5_03761 [Cladophialophora psammophila CBS 110553]EXJ72615.1 hypothetical protein A1O5_03761 [Cladophialophora psammophila CBS 110553]
MVREAPMVQASTWGKLVNGVKQDIAAANADLLPPNAADHSLRLRNGDSYPLCRPAAEPAAREAAARSGRFHSRQGAQRRTVLHVAAKKGHVDMVEPLIRLGCDVTAVDAKGWRPLHHAVNGQHLEVFLVLLKHGDQASGLLMTGKEKEERLPPLRTVLRHGNTKVMELLPNAGIPLYE